MAELHSAEHVKHSEGIGKAPKADFLVVAANPGPKFVDGLVLPAFIEDKSGVANQGHAQGHVL